MLDHDFAQRFANEWIAAWNARDVDAVLDHYDDTITFTSPFITRVVNEPSGTLSGKPALRDYFDKALAINTSLRFDLITVFRGIDSLVLHYRSHRANGSVLAAEVLIFGENGKVVRGYANYDNEV